MMSTRDRVIGLAATAVAALFLAATFVLPAFAEVGDGDGFDGDELGLPLLLGAAVVIGLVVYWRSRRSPNQGT